MSGVRARDGSEPDGRCRVVGVWGGATRDADAARPAPGGLTRGRRWARWARRGAGAPSPSVRALGRVRRRARAPPDLGSSPRIRNRQGAGLPAPPPSREPAAESAPQPPQAARGGAGGDPACHCCRQPARQAAERRRQLGAAGSSAPQAAPGAPRPSPAGRRAPPWPSWPAADAARRVCASARAAVRPAAAAEFVAGEAEWAAQVVGAHPAQGTGPGLEDVGAALAPHDGAGGGRKRIRLGRGLGAQHNCGVARSGRSVSRLPTIHPAGGSLSTVERRRARPACDFAGVAVLSRRGGNH